MRKAAIISGILLISMCSGALASSSDASSAYPSLTPEKKQKIEALILKTVDFSDTQLSSLTSRLAKYIDARTQDLVRKLNAANRLQSEIREIESGLTANGMGSMTREDLIKAGEMLRLKEKKAMAAREALQKTLANLDAYAYLLDGIDIIDNLSNGSGGSDIGSDLANNAIQISADLSIQGYKNTRKQGDETIDAMLSQESRMKALLESVAALTADR